MTEQTDAPRATTPCALDGCDTPVVQPAGGGRHRLYCSNAHRAEARRRRLADATGFPPADVLDASIDRLAAVVDDLTRHRDKLRSIDPAQAAAEAARLRAQVTGEILAAQQAAALAAEEVSRAHDELTAERTKRAADLDAHQHQVTELTALLTSAKERTAAVLDELDRARAEHDQTIHERDARAARLAAAHDADTAVHLRDLEAARTAVAAAAARASEADHRAARTEAARNQAADEAARLAKALQRNEIELASTQVTATTAAQRVADLAGRLQQADSEVNAERRRNDLRLTELQAQLAKLLSRRPQRRQRLHTKPSATDPLAALD